MDHPKNASWLSLVAAIGLVTGALGCAADPDPAGGAQQNAGTGGAGSGGTAPGLGGSGGGAQISSAAGSGGQAAGGGGAGASGSGGASIAKDASTGTVVDAGQHTDAARPDADTGADASVGGPGCAGSTFALCEDFESGALDSQVWKSVQSKGTVMLDSSRGARGSKSSVHVHVDPGSDTMVGLTEQKTFPALKEKLFARAFIFIPSAMASSIFMEDRHSRLIYAHGEDPEGEYALGIWNGGLIQNHYSESDDSVDTKMLPPFDEWFCLEYELDSAQGNVRAYLNDAEITALKHDGWPATNVETLMFGVDRYGSFPVAEDIWFDDLVVDSAHIGCTR